MTQKELHRLHRQDVLQLLLAQSEEAEQLKKELAETKQALSDMEANYEKLRKRLDHKDEQIHHLRDMLEEHRKRRRIELEEAGSIAEAALRLNGIFEAAQKAADQYLYNLQLSTAERMREEIEDDGMLEDPEDEGQAVNITPEKEPSAPEISPENEPQTANTSPGIESQANETFLEKESPETENSQGNEGSAAGSILKNEPPAPGDRDSSNGKVQPEEVKNKPKKFLFHGKRSK